MRVVAVGLAALVLAGFAAAAGYNAGWTRGGIEAVQALPVAAAEVSPGTAGPAVVPAYGPGPYPYGYGWRGYGWGPGWGHGAPFGFVFPLFGFLFFFLFLKLVFFGFWGGRHRGGMGRWEHARELHDSWHRREDGPAGTGSTSGTGGTGGTSGGMPAAS